MADILDRYPGLRSVVRQAIQSGITRSAALELYRRLGGHIRTQTFYRAFGEAETFDLYKSALSRAPSEQVVPRHLITPTNVNLQARFQYVLEFSYFSEFSNRVETQRASVLSDDRLSPDEAQRQFLESIDQGQFSGSDYGRASEDILSLSLIAVLQRSPNLISERQGA